MDMNVFYSLSYGVYLVTTMDEGRPTGCVANSVMQVTAEPPVLALSISRENHTHQCLSRTGRLALTILSETSDPSLIGRFGFASGRDKDKFQNLPYALQDGLPLPEAQSCGWLTCRVVGQTETATHTIFLAEVLDGGRGPGKTPMTYAYYHSVIKGSSPKTAPTYLPPQPEEKAPAAPRWKCSICGYIYDGAVPFGQLPEDYLCPVCLQPKSVFVQI